MIERYSLPAMQAVWTEEAKFHKWLQVELAVCAAYFEREIIPKKEYETICKKARFDVNRINEIEKEVGHDVIAFLTSIAEFVGEPARFIHLGLTSSDVVDTGLSLQLAEATRLLLQDVDGLLATLKSLALRYKNTLMMGRTHGVHAEPTTFGLRLALWYDELSRGKERLQAALETVRVGKLSGAVGNFANVEPEIQDEVCQKLGLQSARISSQILQRDRHAFFLSILAILGGTIEKMALGIRSLQITEIGEVEEPFGEKQKGSSAMPHKKNPVVCERLCGLARVIRSYAMTAMENMPLWHERDISHSSTERIIFPDSCGLLDYMFQKMDWILKNLVVHEDRMKKNVDASHGLVYSQRILLQLVERGVTREEAYQLVQKNAMQARERGKNLKEVIQGDLKIRKYLQPDELEALFDPTFYLSQVDTLFERVGLRG